MGSGGYSQSDRSIRSASLGYQTKSASEIFSRSLNEGMNPKGVTLRESRDSEEHPNSIAIILALDVTGSMGYIPHELVKDGLPTIMANIIERGNPDPQVMFLAIGDHKTDHAPLQISQFESSDEMLDHWLTTTWLEGNGGGNGGESYSLAHFFASHYTSIDCFEKRAQKGFLFTIGDDKTHRDYDSRSLSTIMGSGDISNYTSAALLAEAREQYEVYHVHVGRSEASGGVKSSWRELLGDHFIDVPDHKDVANVISRIICENTHQHKKDERITECDPIINTNPVNVEETEHLL